MLIQSVKIRNYKAIKELEIKNMENTCILVGKNNTGKTVVLDAILTAMGQKPVKEKHFHQLNGNIEIGVRLKLFQSDIEYIWKSGSISRFKKYDLFIKDFLNKLPSYEPDGEGEGVLSYTFIVNRSGRIKYSDGYKKHNPYIPLILPKIYYIDHRRNIDEIEQDILETGMYESDQRDGVRNGNLRAMRENKCMFDNGRNCNGCYQCIGKIMKKDVQELSVYETEKLLEYKLLHRDNDNFMDRLNEFFHKNSGLSDRLVCIPAINIPGMLKTRIVRSRENSDVNESIYDMSEGFKSIYILSLLETYMLQETKLPCILMIEDPELFLHPQMQKTASELLYRLSKKNQVIFSTHAPSMLFNFNSRQIKQIQLDRDRNAYISERVDISRVLDDLGYSANDLMDVSFVFIVEGKQDKQRLPLILAKFYSEICDERGGLNRVAIISTNSCTNIKTYANLKYMNRLYLKDQFLMIRDGDGKNPEELKGDLCEYYKKRRTDDMGDIPRVAPRNVLILKYYSLENYFLNPGIMAEIGVINSEEDFYNILFEKFNEYLYRLKSFIRMKSITGIEIKSPKDIKDNLEAIRKYGRGHNLYDIFYGRFRGEAENDLLRRYIEIAGREEFDDILDAMESFAFFNSRKKS